MVKKILTLVFAITTSNLLHAQVGVGFDVSLSNTHRSDGCQIDREGGECASQTQNSNLGYKFPGALTFDFNFDPIYASSAGVRSNVSRSTHPSNGRPIARYSSSQFFGFTEPRSNFFNSAPLVDEAFTLKNPFTEAQWYSNETSVYSFMSFAGLFRSLSVYEDTGEVRWSSFSWSIGNNQNWNLGGVSGTAPQYVVSLLLQGRVAHQLTAENFNLAYSTGQFLNLLQDSIDCEDCLTLDGGTTVIERSTGESLQYSVIFDGVATMRSLSGVAAPIPEPSTYALMALGLGAIAFRARRRKAAPPVA